MTSIITNQNKTDAIQAGLAFRYAYDRAKLWKASIWWAALFLAIVQSSISICVFLGKPPPFDPAYLVTVPLLLFMLISTLGKYSISKWQTLGCTIQRLHDYLTMNIGIKPSYQEVSQADVFNYSEKRKKKHPTDLEQIPNWWPSNLSKVPDEVAKLIATYYTFSWETELRKKYAKTLLFLIFIFIMIPIAISIALKSDITLLECLTFVFAPFTPIITVVLDEFLTNKQNFKMADNLTTKCINEWNNLLINNTDTEKLEIINQENMASWQNFRQSATPIFALLYKFTRKRTGEDMQININQLIYDYNEKWRGNSGIA